MDKYCLRMRLASRLGVTTVVIDRTSVLSNLRWEVERTGKKAKHPAYRGLVRLILAVFLETARAHGGDRAITIVDRRDAVLRGLAPGGIVRHSWPPHALTHGRGWPCTMPPVELMADIAGAFCETQEDVKEAADESQLTCFRSVELLRS